MQQSNKQQEYLDSVKSDLIDIIESIRVRDKLTQIAMSSKLGITQPRYSNLVRKQLDKFSIEFIMLLLLRLEAKIQITYLLPRLASASLGSAKNLGQ